MGGRDLSNSKTSSPEKFSEVADNKLNREGQLMRWMR